MPNHKKAAAWISWQLTKLRHFDDDLQQRRFRLHTHPYGAYITPELRADIVRPIPQGEVRIVDPVAFWADDPAKEIHRPVPPSD